MPEASETGVMIEMKRSLLMSLLLLAASVHAQTLPEVETIVKNLKPGIPTISAEQVRKSASPGLYEVSVGANIGYVTADGKYFIRGDMIDIASLTNVTEERRKHDRLAAIGAIDPQEAIVFAPAQPKHTVTVFTDVDCPYCRKLHSEIASYNEAGIAIRYLPFPRQGPATPSWPTMEAVWCSKDKQAAFTQAKLGKKIERPEHCDKSPVAKDYVMGVKFGIVGTPALLLEDGTMVSGYMPAKELLETIEKPAAARTAAAAQ
jgi:thiol:disulfide interchange protein DsbC